MTPRQIPDVRRDEGCKLDARAYRDRRLEELAKCSVRDAGRSVSDMLYRTYMDALALGFRMGWHVRDNKGK